MPEGTIRMVLEGADDVVDARDFIRIMSTTIAILHTFDAETQWSIMSASKSSPLDVGLHSASEGSMAAIGIFLSGMSTLEEERRRPRGFDDSVLMKVKRLSKPLGEGVRRLSFSSNGGVPVTVSKRSAATADALIFAPSYDVQTALEGTLGQITVHGGKAEFCIYDPLSGRPTRCHFNPKDAEKVGGLITHRLRVFGKAKYSRSHEPQTISVETWEGPLGEPLLSIAEIHDVGFEWEGDVRPEEALSLLRDADV